MDYILQLREYIGHRPLLMVGAAILVIDQDDRMLLMKRSDSGCWGPPGGAVEPGEYVEQAAKRETLEETRLEIDEISLFGVFSGPELYYQYPNGDEVYNVTIIYLSRHWRGEVEINEEHTEFGWFAVDDIPENISPPIIPVIAQFKKTTLECGSSTSALHNRNSMSNIQNFYAENVQNEWERLGVRHRTEFALTLRALNEFLPSAPAKIIDIGGGPGRYALALAEQGYGVTLVDLAEGNLAFAREKARETGVKLEGVFHKNALDLSAFPAESFDAALLMGPLYHLWQASERLQALREARRLLKPGGVIFASFISRFAAFRDGAAKGFAWILEEPETNEKLLKTGINEGDEDGFTDAYFAHPDEVIPLGEVAGFQTILRLGCEGVVSGHEAYVNSLTGPDFEIWSELNYRIGKDPAAIGASDHILYIGQKTRE